ncbi:hypothetical protein HaLaN_02686 [Haematococcus lacustris]|uniref:Uncharacterized protein n=1 Tax=Haematococcus lacustris TaxID=44745 RepID=A0A699YLN3_HAELA|nr:hypothetical protein HaLaN_02686 [Haematococcus lacustris]
MSHTHYAMHLLHALASHLCDLTPGTLLSEPSPLPAAGHSAAGWSSRREVRPRVSSGWGGHGSSRGGGGARTREWGAWSRLRGGEGEGVGQCTSESNCHVIKDHHGHHWGHWQGIKDRQGWKLLIRGQDQCSVTHGVTRPRMCECGCHFGEIKRSAIGDRVPPLQPAGEVV